MATTEEIQKLSLYWSEVIQVHMETVHSTRLEFVPKGDSTTIVSLLANWGTAIPNTYAEPTEAQLLTALGIVEAQISADADTEAIQANAGAGFKAIPNWATWTAQEAADWINTNVTDLPSAKVAMVRMAMAMMWMADAVFPDRR